MKSVLSIILLAWIVLVPPAECTKGQPANIAQQAVKYVEQGDAYFNRGSYDEALNAYTTAIGLDSRLATAYWGRGRVYHFDKNAYLVAVDNYSKAIELNPEYARAFYYRGLAYTANGGYDRAISDFTRAVELEPGLTMVYDIRAWCYVQKAQWDQSSLLYLYQLLESDSGLAEAYRGNGWVYVKRMQWEFATIPELFRPADFTSAKSDNAATNPDGTTAASEINKLKLAGKPSVKVTPVSGPVGTKLFIYGWGFRGNEDGMTITWDGEIIVCDIRAELDGSMIIDGSKVPNVSPAYTGDTRGTVYVPLTTRGRHILGVYGSSFTPRGTLNDTVFEVIPEIRLSTEPSAKGIQVTISGTGFASKEVVAVSLDKSISNVTADGMGSFKTIFTIPADRGKEYTIVATGDKGSSAKASFVTALVKPVPADNPDLSEVYCNRGFAHFKKAQWALAISDLDSAYTKDKALDRGSWNKDWALGKQKQWDLVISDYSKVVSLGSNSPINQNISGSGMLKEELAQALADYSKAADLSKDPAFVQKIKDSIKFIEAWSKGT